MSTKIKHLIIQCNDRKEIRKQVISKFLEEEPGTGTGENTSRYTYIVEELMNSDKVLLKRPASLNKGVDFEIHVEGIQFRDRGRNINMPRHSDIINDLKQKKDENNMEYDKVIEIINKLYRCEEVSENEYRDITFNVGYPIEAILKSIKWMFIEQDVTYWNWSGRAMLYLKLKEEGLC